MHLLISPVPDLLRGVIYRGLWVGFCVHVGCTEQDFGVESPRGPSLAVHEPAAQQKHRVHGDALFGFFFPIDFCFC